MVINCGVFSVSQIDRRYSEKHEWISVDTSDKTVGTVGISHYAQEALGDVVYVQAPDIGAEVKQDGMFKHILP